jgi:hypothetical protein
VSVGVWTRCCARRQDLRVSGALLLLGCVSQVVSYRLMYRVALRIEAYVDPSTGDEWLDVHHMSLFGRGVQSYRRQGPSQCRVLMLACFGRTAVTALLVARHHRLLRRVSDWFDD